MKKTYINPELEVVELQMSQQIMTGSPKLGGDYTTGKPVLAPEYDWDEDEFEEY